MHRPSPLARTVLPAMSMLVVLVTACSSTTVSHSFTSEVVVPYRPGALVDIESSNGGVELVVDPARSDVHILMTARTVAGTADAARARAAASSIAAERSASGTLMIRPSLAEPRRAEDSAGLVVTIPGAAGAALRTTNGAIRVTGVAGDVEARTSNGRIRLDDIDGSVKATTVNGAVEAARIGGEVEARTTNGRVTVSDAGGRVSVETTNGSITLREVGAPIEVSTTNGSADVALRGTVGELDVGARNGQVTVQRGGETLASLRGGSAVVTIGPGPTRSRIRTTNGSVRVTVAGGATG